jgi:hypothetical protein
MISRRATIKLFVVIKLQHVGDSDIKNNGVCTWATMDPYTAEIYGNDLKNLSEIYLRQLLKWAAIVWSYDQVEVWTWAKTEEISQSSGPGYYCIWGGSVIDPAHLLHICDRDDIKGVFGGSWPDSPPVLPNWEERINSMRIRIRDEMSWSECANCGRSTPGPVYEGTGCAFCGGR